MTFPFTSLVFTIDIDIINMIIIINVCNTINICITILNGLEYVKTFILNNSSDYVSSVSNISHFIKK